MSTRMPDFLRSIRDNIGDILAVAFALAASVAWGLMIGGAW